MGVASIIISSGHIRECASSGVGVHMCMCAYVHVRDSETELPGKHYKPSSITSYWDVL